MSRADRRAYNKKHKTKLTREQFDAIVAVARIQSGNLDLSDLKVPQDFVHMDNTELAPDGTACRLNYEEIIKRPNADKTPQFLEWVEKHKDEELHITRDGAVNSLICFEEDERFVVDPETNLEVKAPKFLFDVYTDILIKDADGQLKTIDEIERSKNVNEDIENKKD